MENDRNPEEIGLKLAKVKRTYWLMVQQGWLCFGHGWIQSLSNVFRTLSFSTHLSSLFISDFPLILTHLLTLLLQVAFPMRPGKVTESNSSSLELVIPRLSESSPPFLSTYIANLKEESGWSFLVSCLSPS